MPREPYHRYASTGPVESYVIKPRSGIGRSLTYVVVFLEPRLEASLQFGSGNRLRIEGEIEDYPVHLAWQPAPGRGHYLMIAPVVKALRLSLGDTVTVRFNLASDDAVVLPVVCTTKRLTCQLSRQPEARGVL